MRQTFLLIPILLAGCGEKTATPPAPPAHAETIAHESELLKLTLTAQAQQRLGIVLARVKLAMALNIDERLLGARDPWTPTV